jgi:hypothetical protein
MARDASKSHIVSCRAPYTIVPSSGWRASGPAKSRRPSPAPEFVWSALDCRTGYVCDYDRETGRPIGAPILLGRLSARIDSRPHPGERCVVTSWQTARDGQRLTAEAALFGEAGNLLAIGRATWTTVDRSVQLGKAKVRARCATPADRSAVSCRRPDKRRESP